MSTTVAVAGATGHMGGLVVKELTKAGAKVIALVRPGTKEAKLNALRSPSVTIAQADLKDGAELQKAVEGAGCIVSTLQGLWDVIVEDQTSLLDAAVAAGVPRFIPSDYALDFMNLKPGTNRNLDLRREFHDRLETRPVRATTILNGAFSTVLTTPGIIVDYAGKKVNYWGDADQLMDFTTIENIAEFTALAAMDDTTPRVLRIAGGEASASNLVETLSDVTGQAYSLNRNGSLEDLAGTIEHLRQSSKDESSVFPQWQGMQYLHNMFCGAAKLEPLDNERYSDVKWINVKAMIASR